MRRPPLSWLEPARGLMGRWVVMVAMMVNSLMNMIRMIRITMQMIIIIMIVHYESNP